MKIVYQTNQGYYVSQTYCQESPLEKGVFLVPSECIEEKPPEIKENEIQYWNSNTWEIKSNYSGKTYYSKIDKSEKYFEIGEEFNNDYTEIIPLQNERFQKWDEDSNNWIIDIDSKNKFELQVRQSTIQRLLLESDYIELPSFIERKGQEIYNKWITYRDNLRLAYHNPELPIPEKPE
jgi:hypothetical protein